MRPRIVLVTWIAYGFLTMVVAFGVMTQGLRITSGPKTLFVNKATSPSTDDLKEFVKRLKRDKEAPLTVVSPVPPRVNETFKFTVVDGPIPGDYAPHLLFARGELSYGDSGHTARVVVVSPTLVKLSVYTEHEIHRITLEGKKQATRYDQLRATKDFLGRTCEVTGKQDELNVERFHLPTLLDAGIDFLPDAVPDIAPNDVPDIVMDRSQGQFRRFRIAIAVTEMVRDEYVEPGSFETDIAHMLFDVNELLNRDLGVDLVMSGKPRIASDKYGSGTQKDVLDRVQSYFETELQGQEMADTDLAQMIEDGEGGRADVGGVCDKEGKLRGVSRTDGLLSRATLNLAHEIGHQLGAPHSFSTDDFYWHDWLWWPWMKFLHPRGAYEPGKGLSLMSWPDTKLAYFHASSMEFVEKTLSRKALLESTCAEPYNRPLGRPIVQTAKTVWHVPANTPFELTASPNAAIDAFRWDEYDQVRPPKGPPPYFHSSGIRGSGRVYPPLATLLQQAGHSPWTAWPPPGARLRFRVVGFGENDTTGYKDVRVEIMPANTFRIKNVACAPCKASNGSLTVEWEPSDTLGPPYNVTTLTASVLDETTNRRYEIPGLIQNQDGKATLPMPAGVAPTRYARLLLHAVGEPFFLFSEQFSIAAR
jgi:hypothetical protein